MPSSNRRRLPWVAAFAAATFLTVLGTMQVYAAHLVDGQSTNLLRTLKVEAADWYAWAAVAPCIFLVLERLPRPASGRARLVAVWVGLGFAATFLHSILEVSAAQFMGIFTTPTSLTTLVPVRFLALLAGRLTIYVLVVLAFYTAEQYRETRARELRESALKAELAEAQLAVLRVGLQPHFLFNALHTVSALMQENVENARRVLTRLSDLLRLSLDQSEANEVPLADELAFLESYLDIQQARFRDRLAVKLVVPDETRTALVPSLLLQPLVENAVRHAIEPCGRPGTVEVRAARAGAELEIEILDDGPGLPPRGVGRTGRGLSNTRARLEHLYGAAHRFELANRPAGGLRVVVRLPYRVESEPGDA